MVLILQYSDLHYPMKTIREYGVIEKIRPLIYSPHCH